MALVQNYKELIVWQKSMLLVEELYKLTEYFPQSEVYGLTAQIRRSAVSIPSNIAEGKRRSTLGEYIQFINIAYASGAELETQLEICKRIPFGKKLNFSTVDGLLDEVMKMLNVLKRKIKEKKQELQVKKSKSMNNIYLTPYQPNNLIT